MFWQGTLSESYNNVGYILSVQGDLAGALESYRESVTINEKLVELEPANTLVQSALAGSYEDVGSALSAQGDLDNSACHVQISSRLIPRNV